MQFVDVPRHRIRERDRHDVPAIVGLSRQVCAPSTVSGGALSWSLRDPGEDVVAREDELGLGQLREDLADGARGAPGPVAGRRSELIGDPGAAVAPRLGARLVLGARRTIRAARSSNGCIERASPGNISGNIHPVRCVQIVRGAAGEWTL